MPRPATVQAARPAATGTAGIVTRTIPPMPARMMTSPARTRRRPSQDVPSRACAHAPAVQDRVAPVTASPASTVLRPRSTVMVSVT